MSRLNLHLPSMFHRSPVDPARSGLDWGTAVGAGLLAGLAFIVAEMLLLWLFQGTNPWVPLHMMAAMVLGREVLPPAGLSWSVVLAAMLVHLPLSAVYGVVLGWMVHRFESDKALLIGLVFGLAAIYLVNFHLVAPAFFPWFVKLRDWSTALAHALFGLVAAGTYVAMRQERHV